MLVTLSMSSSHYLGSRRPSERLHDNLPEVSGESPPPAVAYQSHELDAFSASGVSSFSYPAATDPTLLTPVSSAGSPPLHQRTVTKTTRPYHSSQTAVSGAQGPTPPSTTRMYYSNYEMSSSQSPSPITVHPQATEAGGFDMTSFVTTHSPSPAAHHHSPRDELPPQPIDPFLPYVVSGGDEVDVTPGLYPSHSFPPVGPNQPSPSFIVRTQPPSTESVTAPQLQHPITPVLTHPNPDHYRLSHTNSHFGSIEDLRDPGMLHSNHASFHPHRPQVPTPRRPAPRKRQTQSRKSLRPPHRTNAAPGTGGAAAVGAADGPVVKKEFISLAEGCSNDDRRLFELRLKYDHMKGKGMWDKIGAEFDDHAQGKGREALQMRVHRMVAKHGVWPEAEERRLEEAFEWCEAHYSKLVLQRLKEIGGCECWEWKPEHVETKLVKKGFVEATPQEKTGARKRKKIGNRNLSHPAHYQQPLPGVMGDWNTGLGLQSNYPRAMAPAYDILNEDGRIQTQPPVLTAEQNDELIDQLFNTKTHFKSEPDDSASPEAMDITYENSNNHPRADSASTSAAEAQSAMATTVSQEERSTRLARQVVSQYLDDDQYNGHRT